MVIVLIKVKIMLYKLSVFIFGAYFCINIGTQ